MKLIVITSLIALAAAVWYGSRQITDPHRLHGHADLPPSVAIREWERSTGLSAGPAGLVVVRSYGAADNMWFEMRLPPEQQPKMVAGMMKVADDRPPSRIVTAEEAKRGVAIDGMPSPDWFDAGRLSAPVRSYDVSLNRWHYWIAFSEKDGTILMRMP